MNLLPGNISNIINQQCPNLNYNFIVYQYNGIIDAKCTTDKLPYTAQFDLKNIMYHVIFITNIFQKEL